ncbi:MAG: DUF4402 domain-containing protein [Bacteroidales bacterium]|nr:DUF4402 domain-containing protein [Bacteroidales bacterium]
MYHATRLSAPCFMLLVYLGFFNSTGILFAQKTDNITIKATARVMEIVEIEMVTIRDMQIEVSSAVDGIISIDPLHDPSAGVMMLKGRPEAQFRVTFLPMVDLQNTRGKGSLLFTYNVHGFSVDDQPAGEPIDAVDRILRFSDQGKYYLWIGGRIDISNARQGSYEGEFTLEIEYI